MSISVSAFGEHSTILTVRDNTKILYLGDYPAAVKTPNFSVVSNRFANTDQKHIIKTFFDGKDHDVLLPEEELINMVVAI